MDQEVNVAGVLDSVSDSCSKLVEKGHEYVFIISNQQQLWQIGSNKGRQFLEANTNLVQKFFEHCYNATAAIPLADATQMVDATHSDITIKDDISDGMVDAMNASATPMEDATLNHILESATKGNTSDATSQSDSTLKVEQDSTYVAEFLDPTTGEFFDVAQIVNDAIGNNKEDANPSKISAIDVNDNEDANRSKISSIGDGNDNENPSPSKISAMASVGLVSKDDEPKGRPKRKITKKKWLMEEEDVFKRNKNKKSKSKQIAEIFDENKNTPSTEVPGPFHSNTESAQVTEGQSDTEQMQTDRESAQVTEGQSDTEQLQTDNDDENADEAAAYASSDDSCIKTEDISPAAEDKENQSQSDSSQSPDMAKLRAWYDKFLKDYKSGKLKPVNKYHSQSKGKTKRVTCQICKLTYLDEKKLKNHLVIHSGIKTFRCLYCNAKFFYASYLTTHVVVCKSNPNRVYNPNKKNLYIEAAKLVLVPSTFEAGIMTAVPKKVANRQHKIFENLNPALSTSFNLDNRTSTALSQARLLAQERKKDPEWEGKKLYQCMICDNTYSAMRHLKRHVVIHTNSKRFTCYFCLHPFFRLEDMKDHVFNFHFKWSKSVRKEAHKLGNSMAEKIRKYNAGEVDESENNNDNLDADNVNYSQAEPLEEETESDGDTMMSKASGKKRKALEVSDISNKCEDCGNIFDNVRELRKHRMRHKIEDKGSTLACSYCDRMFAKEESLEAHKYVCRKKLKSNKLQGTKGSDRTGQIGNKGKNVAEVDRKSSVKMTKVGNKVIESKNVKMKGVKGQEKGKQNGKVKAGIKPKVHTYNCDICEETFFERYNLVWHILTCHGIESISECPLCDQKLENGSVKKHLSQHDTFHNIPTPAPVADPLPAKPSPSSSLPCFECNRCDFTCTVLYDLWRHQALHVEEKSAPDNSKKSVYKKMIRKGYEPGQCTICGKSFTIAKNAQRHYNTVHSDERNVVCELCGKAFKTLGCYQLHAKTHNKDMYLRYPCEICGKKFMKPSRLKMHVSVHTKEKAYMCEHCGKTFRMQANLIKHKHLVHTTARNYKCELCAKTFKMRENWRNHMRRHVITDGIDNTGNKYGRVLECEVCGKKMTVPHKFKIHLATHNKQTSFECEICGIVFTRKNLLKEHLLQTHRQGDAGAEADEKGSSLFLSSMNNTTTSTSVKVVHPTNKVVSRLKLEGSGKIIELVTESPEYSEVKYIENDEAAGSVTVQDLGLITEVVQTEQPDNMVVLQGDGLTEEDQQNYYMITDGHDDEQTISVLYIPNPVEEVNSESA